MPVIIDGNNLLHAPKPPALAGLDELGLCRALGRTMWGREGVRIVCDGDPGPLNRPASPVGGIELVYAGANRSADAVIEQLVAADTAPRRLLVVSTDRRVQRAAQRRRARAWDSERFLHELAAALASRSAQPDPGAAPDATLPPEQVEQWLATFGYRAEPDVDDAEADADDWTRYWHRR